MTWVVELSDKADRSNIKTALEYVNECECYHKRSLGLYIEGYHMSLETTR